MSLLALLEGPQFNLLAISLNGCPWEELAYELNVETGNIATIRENCDQHANKAICCRRELTHEICKRYDTHEAARIISKALENMGYKAQANSIKRTMLPEEYTSELPTQPGKYCNN